MQKENILIVEDERVVAMDIQNRLKVLGYSVCGSASSGEDAVKKASELQPDLVLMDIVLKGEVDGIEAAGQIREHLGIPVVYLTAFSDEKTLQRARLTGPYGYILKPFEDSELRSNIEMALYKRVMEARIEHLNRVIRAIRSVNQLIVREKDPDHLIQGACDNLIATRGFHNAWIALLDENEEFMATAEAGLGKDFLPMVEWLKRGELTECAKRALAETDVVVIKDPSATCLDCPLARNYYGKAGMSIRMEHGGKVYGLLTVSTPIDFMTEEELSLFKEIAGDISFALHAIEIEKERKRSEEALTRSELELRIRNQIANIFLTIPDEEMYGEVLQVILEAMESKYGTFGYIDEKGNLVNPSMTRDIWDKCQVPDKDIVFPRETWGGIWGKALIKKKTLYSNKPFKVPEGHILITRALDVPIIQGGEVIGNLLLGNKETDYDEEDKKLLEDIADYIAPVLKARLQRDRHDIDRKNAEKALRESEEHYRNIFEDLRDAVYITTRDGKFIDANQSALDLFGYSRGEMASVNALQLYVHPGDAGRFEKEIEKKGFFRDYEVTLRKKDGTEMDCLFNTTVRRANDGSILAYQGIIHDMTERKKLEAQFIQSQKMEAIGALAGGIAHDFNNLLTTIIGCSDLMMMSIGKDHELRENLEDIRKAGDRAASLTRQLLAFSRKQILAPKVINLNHVIPDIDKMLRRLIGEDIDLETVLAPDLGRVEADPGQIEQIIMNLAVNARDAMSRGGKLTMETANVDLNEAYARSHADVTAGPYVMMAISDSGTGMDEETLSKVFDPFFTTKEEGKGTGLGLSMVYGIVKQSNGNIWVYSEPGKGTTFKIYLPRVEKDALEKEEVEATAESLTGSETILVVEDNEMVRNLAQTILQHYGYSVLAAQDGEEAIKVSKEHDGPIDLMLTDVVMPKMSGKEVAERLNALRPDMKVLYMSGYTGNAIVHHGVLDREMRFIQKPFTTESLARKVREVLD